MHKTMLEMTSNWLDDYRDQSGVDLNNIVDPVHRSPTVSTIQLPAVVSVEDFLVSRKH